MNNKVYVDRLKEQYNILAELMTNIPAQLDERPEEFVLGENTFTEPTLCGIWEFIRCILIGKKCNPRDGILDKISCILKELLDDGIRNCALKAEIQRALRLINCLIKALRDIDCDNNREKLVGRLFCLLVRLVLILLALIAKLIILLLVCEDYDIECDDVKVGFCRCLIDEFAKELNDLCKLIDEFEFLAMEFKKCDRPCGCNNTWDCDRPCGCNKGGCGCNNGCR